MRDTFEYEMASFDAGKRLPYGSVEHTRDLRTNLQIGFRDLNRETLLSCKQLGQRTGLCLQFSNVRDTKNGRKRLFY